MGKVIASNKFSNSLAIIIENKIANIITNKALNNLV